MVLLQGFNLLDADNMRAVIESINVSEALIKAMVVLKTTQLGTPDNIHQLYALTDCLMAFVILGNMLQECKLWHQLNFNQVCKLLLNSEPGDNGGRLVTAFAALKSAKLMGEPYLTDTFKQPQAAEVFIRGLLILNKHHLLDEGYDAIVNSPQHAVSLAEGFKKVKEDLYLPLSPYNCALT